VFLRDHILRCFKMAKLPYPPSHTHTHKHTHSPPLCSLSQSLSLSSHTHTHTLSPLLYTYIYTCMYVHTGTRIAKGAANVAYSLKGTKECTFELLLGKRKETNNAIYLVWLEISRHAICCDKTVASLLFHVLLVRVAFFLCLSPSLSFFRSLPLVRVCV